MGCLHENLKHYMTTMLTGVERILLLAADTVLFTCAVHRAFLGHARMSWTLHALRFGLLVGQPAG